jgi:hypothetical protein
MSTNDESMQPQQGAMGAGMSPGGGAEMDPEAPEMHTLDPEDQRANMGLAEAAGAMGEPPGEMPSADEIAQHEEAAKRGDTP